MVGEKCYSGVMGEFLRKAFKMKASPSLVLGAVTPVVDVGLCSVTHGVYGVFDVGVGFHPMILSRRGFRLFVSGYIVNLRTVGAVFASCQLMDYAGGSGVYPVWWSNNLRGWVVSENLSFPNFLCYSDGGLGVDVADNNAVFQVALRYWWEVV